MKLHKRIDFNEDDATYMKLIRIGHAIWRAWRQEKRRGGQTVPQQRAFTEAIEIMVRLKEECKAELRSRAQVKAVRTRDYFAARRPAQLELGQ